MKKIAALIGVFLLIISCSPENDQAKIHFELLPIESVVLPVNFTVNNINEIEINFLRPTSCHGFDGFLYEKNDFTRTIALQSYVLEKDNCAALTNEIVTQKLNFKPLETGIYLLRFWKGKDTNGVDIFEEISVDVQ